MAATLCFIFLLSCYFSPIHGVFSQQSHIVLPSESNRIEKLTHLHFYYHDIIAGKNPSMLQIINTPKNVPNGFGSYFVMDDIMTEGPELSSKHVGRAQGLFGLASKQQLAEAMFLNFVFTEGVYAGSSLTMLGRNPIDEQNREMSIVGGTRVFRHARGYAIANDVKSISTFDHLVVEYNVTVYHP